MSEQIPASQVEPSAETDSAAVARELTGDLPCARCGYNQRGLSILGACPECGLPVKATILALVDPHADELKQITHPRLVQAGLLLWTASAFAACAAIWVVRGAQIASDVLAVPLDPAPAPALSLVFMALSGLGAIVLIRPHRDLRPRHSVPPLLGVLCYLPLIVASWLILYHVDPAHPSVYGNPTSVPPERTALRLLTGLSIIGASLLLRPNAVRLAQRSVLMRTGRVDRQPMSALAAAAGVAMAGDLIHFFMPYASTGLSDLIYILAAALIAVGSFLLTVGIFSLTMDAWRIRRLIAAPGIGLTDIFDEHRP
ncbi:MAG: hypothetical protein KJZ65_00370 [Phycisphaerales bacterium]|nr:hypothetical protein [Phycisphaerales bacterium]